MPASPLRLSLLAVALATTVGAAAALPTAHRPLGWPPRFQDFPAAKYRGKLHPTDLTSAPDARRFRTRLRLSVGDTVNFAGHLRVVLWGCGTQCLSGAIVDARDGHVYDLPQNLSADADFRVDSRLFIVNPEAAVAEIYPDTAARPDWAHPIYFVWTGQGFALLDSLSQDTQGPPSHPEGPRHR